MAFGDLLIMDRSNALRVRSWHCLNISFRFLATFFWACFLWLILIYLDAGPFIALVYGLEYPKVGFLIS